MVVDVVPGVPAAEEVAVAGVIGMVIWGLGGTAGLLMCLAAKSRSIRDGFHQLGLGLFQQAIDVLRAELGQAGTLLLPVPLCCLTHIRI